MSRLHDSGGKGGKLLYQCGEISYIVVFPTPGIAVFPGGKGKNGYMTAPSPILRSNGEPEKKKALSE